MITPCCNSFLKIAQTFSWMSYSDENGNDILCMPHIFVKDIRYRINNCPSCGKEVIDFKIPVSEFSNQ